MSQKHVEIARRIFKGWATGDFAATRLRIAGDTVLADVVQHGKGRASGIDIRTPYFLLLTFRAGKIVRMESVLDEDAALEAAGLSE